VSADHVVRFATAISSSISKTGTVEINLNGIAGLDYDDDATDNDPAVAGQTMDNAEQFSAPGIMGRPLPPRVVNGTELHMDIIALVTADGLVPIAYRDLRIKMGGNAPGEGVMAFVGYGGGFHSMTPIPKNGDPAGGGTLQTIYCPYAFSGETPAKAHTIILDPTEGNESVMIVHGDGMAVTLFDNAVVMKNKAGDATFRLDDAGVTITAQTIVLSGGVIVGEPALAVPLLAGPASPPSSKLWVSP
jgi:hypothetical protein